MSGRHQTCTPCCRKSALFRALADMGLLTMSCSCPRCSRCCDICASTNRIEQNHPCGRNHVPWLTLPNCQKHHREFHIRLALAGVDLRYTSDEQERLRRAKKSWLTYQLMREEYQEAKSKEQSCKTTRKR